MVSEKMRSSSTRLLRETGNTVNSDISKPNDKLELLVPRGASFVVVSFHSFSLNGSINFTATSG